MCTIYKCSIVAIGIVIIYLLFLSHNNDQTVLGVFNATPGSQEYIDASDKMEKNSEALKKVGGALGLN